MSVNIEIGKGADGCQDFVKVGAVALLSCDSFIIRGKSRILMLYDMGGADDKVKIIGSCVVGNFFEVIWLESQFNAEFNINLFPEFLPGAEQIIEIGIGIL